MRHRPAPLLIALSLSLALGAGVQPAQATGLISTERVAGSNPPSGPAAAETTGQQRMALLEALAAAGVEPGQAQARVAAMTDAEIAELSLRFGEAPAGGLWFTPFLVVAIVIGALIGARSRGADAQATDLFGRQRNAAALN